MSEFEQVTITLQSGDDVRIEAWSGSDSALPVVIVAPETDPEDWTEFAGLVAPSHSPVLAEVNSPLQLLHLIWEIGEPVLLLSQGAAAAEITSATLGNAPGAVSAFALCDGVIPSNLVETMHAVSTLILRGRQSELTSHEDAVRLHDSLPHSMLIEPEDCGDFPAKDNPVAAATALNMFTAGYDQPSAGEAEGEPEPVDPQT